MRTPMARSACWCSRTASPCIENVGRGNAHVQCALTGPLASCRPCAGVYSPLLPCLTGTAFAGEAPPVSSLPAARVQQQVLELVNQARARGQLCGAERFGPALPVLISDKLYRAARAHARDMAMRGFFEHEGSDGSSPRQRVQRAGYQFHLTGENIAFGPETAAEVVNGWLGSAGHCANLHESSLPSHGRGGGAGKQARTLLLGAGTGRASAVINAGWSRRDVAVERSAAGAFPPTPALRAPLAITDAAPKNSWVTPSSPALHGYIGAAQRGLQLRAVTAQRDRCAP